MKKFKFKENIQKDKKAEQLDKLISADSITDEEARYGHIYRVLKMLNLSPDKCKTLMSGRYKCSNMSLINDVIRRTDGLHCSEFETNSPFVDIYCTNHIDKYLDPEDDLVLRQDKQGNNKYIKINELKYYYFRLTKKLFESGGYTNTIVRNYFLSPGFKQEYKSRTNRNVNSHKIALFNRILNQYGLINVHKVKKKANLYVLGINNPCYYFQNVMETEDLSNIHAIIDDNKYYPVKLTPKDEKIKLLEKDKKEQQDQIVELQEQVHEMQIQIDSKGVTQEDYTYTLKYNLELLQECQKLSGLVDKVGKWNIVNKPVKPVEFERKFHQLVCVDLSEKKKEEAVLEEVNKVA